MDHLAFQLVRVQNLPDATQAVADSYGAYHIVSALSVAIMTGWTVLAVGAWGTRALGVLKGTTLLSIIAVAGLAIALVPLGVQVLRQGPTPSSRVILGWSSAILAVITAMTILGTPDKPREFVGDPLTQYHKGHAG